ncbi:MAG: hypothetical protein J6Q58_01130 [Clostridia bacterium]|nr:hypothetical protein [Clostridia bacterium]
MLKKEDESVLKVISDNAFSGESCLISKESIVAFVNNEKLVNDTNVEEILKNLYANDYIDLLLSSKKGETFYCITLLKRGKNYKEEKRAEISKVKNKILLAVIGAIVSFIVGRILIAIFT